MGEIWGEERIFTSRVRVGWGGRARVGYKILASKGRVQKKIVEFSTKGGRSATADFPLRKAI